MASTSAPPVDLYIAAYPDPDAAREDWDTIKQLANDDMIKVEGLILVSRRSDGKIHVDDDFHETRKGAKWGAVGGAVLGLIFPPALLASAAVGAGVGAGVGGLVSHGRKEDIRADVEDVLPAQQLRGCRDLRGAVGRRRRHRSVERTERHQREGRSRQRRAGQGRSRQVTVRVGRR